MVLKIDTWQGQIINNVHPVSTGSRLTNLGMKEAPNNLKSAQLYYRQLPESLYFVFLLT